MLVDRAEQPLRVKPTPLGLSLHLKAQTGHLHFKQHSTEIILDFLFEAMDMWSLGVVMAFFGPGDVLSLGSLEHDAASHHRFLFSWKIYNCYIRTVRVGWGPVVKNPLPLYLRVVNMSRRTQSSLDSTSDDTEPEEEKETRMRTRKRRSSFQRFLTWMRTTFCSCIDVNEEE
ncbi:homeodomain-interacting protein kinase 2-like isoform X1 [Lates japonicus]|uniref:Homeodomain-interacting protein kinase 2-like isoform X1 n=1 Tax=Lates japonicus TaxID=270547 RepID=A0AAD3M3L2_LATJO|nr:homeodomain-interacting protein kinase 2-like isoform X1 [Lates japonicus]